jgi:hypothetical protein
MRHAPLLATLLKSWLGRTALEDSRSAPEPAFQQSGSQPRGTCRPNSGALEDSLALRPAGKRPADRRTSHNEPFRSLAQGGPGGAGSSVIRSARGYARRGQGTTPFALRQPASGGIVPAPRHRGAPGRPRLHTASPMRARPPRTAAVGRHCGTALHKERSEFGLSASVPSVPCSGRLSHSKGGSPCRPRPPRGGGGGFL